MNRRGFTLVEIIITLIVMAILGIMAAQLLSTTLRGSAESAAQVTDFANAVSTMEQVVAVMNTEEMLDAKVTQDTRCSKAQSVKSGNVVAGNFPGSGNAILVTVTLGNVELSRVF